jgi:ABC-type amino acid transport substrate-binding protein
MRSKNRNLHLKAGACLVTLGLLGAACGSDDSDDGAAESVADTEAVPAASGEAATTVPESADTEAPSGDGSFDPPPILTDVPESVATACEGGGLIDEVRDRGTLNWAIGVSPPFGFKLPDGSWAGIEAQNAAELAGILGVDYDITDYSYDVLPNTLTTGQADIIGAQLFVTPARQEVIDFSTPYYKSGQLFYVLADSEYQTIEDLNTPDTRFVYGTGGAQLDLAEKYVPEASISDAPLRGQLLLYDLLAAGQADATMTEAAPMPVIFSKFPDPALAAIGLNGRITAERPAEEDMLDPFDVAFGLPKDDAAWKGCVDAWIADLLDSGRMNERLDYWLSQDVA